MGLLVAGAMIPWVSLHYGWRTNFAVLAVIGLVWCGLWLLGREGTIDSLRRGQLATPDAHRLPYRRLLGDPSVLGNYLAISPPTGRWPDPDLGAQLPAGRPGHGPAAHRAHVRALRGGHHPLSLFMAWVSQRLLRRGLPSRLARGAFVSLCLIAGGLFSASLMLELPVAVRIVNLTLSGGLALVMYSVGPAMLAEFTPASQRGGILAIGNAVASLAGLSAPVVTGLLVSGAGAAHPQGYAQGFLVCGAVLVVAGLVGLVTMNPQRSQERLAQDETSAACSRA